ncbi:hypothetical protein ACP3P8_05245 [Pseudomonas aeruginosa]
MDVSLESASLGAEKEEAGCEAACAPLFNMKNKARTARIASEKFSKLRGLSSIFNNSCMPFTSATFSGL